MQQPIFCVCGKLCTSKAGLTLHQRNCKPALSAITSGKSAVKESDIIFPRVELIPEMREFFELAELVAYDSNSALVDGNKSAGRRARVGMIKMRNIMIPLRKKILKKIK